MCLFEFGDSITHPKVDQSMGAPTHRLSHTLSHKAVLSMNFLLFHSFFFFIYILLYFLSLRW